MAKSKNPVLLITRNLPPVIGGMERLIGRVADTLSTHYSTVVIGPRSARTAVPPSAMLGCPLSPLPLFLAAAAMRSIEAAQRYHPQLVIAGSGLTAPMARLAAYRAKVPYMVYLHGLDIVTPQALYQRVFMPAIRNADLVLANSQYTKELAVQAGIPKNHIHLLHPGVEIPHQPINHQEATRIFRNRFALPTGPILLGVGRLTPRKGFALFVERALPTILEDVPDAQFVIAGEVPKHGVQHSGNEASAIFHAARAQNIESHVHLIGAPSDTTLDLAWYASDAHIFPAQNHPKDPEGFGMVAIEAAAHGVPTVAFASGGIPDAVSDGVSGFLVTSGDYYTFARKVITSLNSKEKFESDARRFAESFSWPHFSERLLSLTKLPTVKIISV